MKLSPTDFAIYNLAKKTDVDATAAVAASDAAAAARDATVGGPRIPDIAAAAAATTFSYHANNTATLSFTGSTADYAAAHEVGTDIAAAQPIDGIGASIIVTATAASVTAKIWSRNTSDSAQSAAGPGQAGDVLIETVTKTVAELGINPLQSRARVWFPLVTTIYAVAGKTYLVEFDARTSGNARDIIRLGYLVDGGSNQRRRGYYRATTGAGTWSNIASGSKLATFLGKKDYVSSASLNTKASALSDTGSLVYGKPTAPVTQTSSSSATDVFVDATKVPRACTLRSIRAYIKNAGTATINIYNSSGVRISTTTFSVAGTGDQTFTSVDFGTIALPANSYFAFGGAASGGARFAYTSGTPDDGGWYQAASTATSFTIGTPNSTYRLEVQYNFDYDAGQVVTATRFLAAEAGVAANAAAVTAAATATAQLIGYIDEVVGRPGGADPITGSTASTAYILLMATALGHAAPLASVTFWAKTVSTYTILRCSFDGTTRTTLASVAYAASATGLNVIPANTLAALGTFDVGDYVAIHGAVAYISGVADGSGWYQGGALASSSVSVGALSTTIQVQVRFTFTRSIGQTVTATAFAALEAGLGDATATAEAALAAASPTFAQDLIPGAYLASQLQRRNLAMMKGNAALGLKRSLLCYVGDSVTDGYRGDGDLYLTQREIAHPSVVARWLDNQTPRMPARYDAIVGASNTTDNVELMKKFDNRLVMGTGWDVHTLGGSGFGSVGGQFFRASGITTDWEYTPLVDWDSVRLLYARAASGTGSACVFDVLIADVVKANDVSTTGTDGIYAQAITADSLDTHTLKVRRVSGGDLYLLGGIFFNSTVPEINVVNCGWSGSTPGSWVNGSAWSANTNLAAMVASDDCAFICNHGINAWIQGTAVATFKTNYQALINSMAALGSVLIKNPVPSQGYPAQPDYAAAIYELCDTNDLPMIDYRKRFIDYNQANALGFMSDFVNDKWHPSALGQYDLATPDIEYIRQA